MNESGKEFFVCSECNGDISDDPLIYRRTDIRGNTTIPDGTSCGPCGKNLDPKELHTLAKVLTDEEFEEKKKTAFRQSRTPADQYEQWSKDYLTVL